jgi:RNA polymerase-binding transcription factor DksA
MNPISDDHRRAARATLLARAAELRERLQRVRGDLKREREPLPRDSADAAIAVENDEVLMAIEQTAMRELSFLDSALERMEHGAYGVCAACSSPIDGGRLRAVPYATHCAQCAPGE